MIGSLSSKKEEIRIYGGGFAGLSMAYRLKQQGLKFSLYEKNSLEGKISSRLTEWGPMESAACALSTNAEVEEFIKELNIPYCQSQSHLKRLIASSGKAKSLPNPDIIATLAMRSFHQFPDIKESSTVADILGPWFGEKRTDEILSTLFQGIYMAEAKDLHFLSLFPWAKEKIFKNYFHFFRAMFHEMKRSRPMNIKGPISFPHGMQELTTRLKEEVDDSVFQGCPEISSLHNNIICTSAPEAARILESSEPQIAEVLSSIKYRPVTSYTFFLENELPTLKESFGLLIPQRYKGPILGIIHQSAIFPENYRAPCYTVISKGVLDQATIHQELKKQNLAFESQKILDDSLSSWSDGLPLYDFTRYEAINLLKDLLKKRPGLMLFGNYTGGISLRSMIEQSRQFMKSTS